MSTITKERLEQLANFRGAPVTRQEEQELARIALASLEAGPVAWAHRLINKRNGVVHPWVYGSAETSPSEGDIFNIEVMPLYAAPPAPVSVPEWTNEQCLEFMSIAFRHAEIKGDLELDDIRLGVRMVNGSRAAMLQGADGNSPVVPDGWVDCSERMPREVLAALQNIARLRRNLNDFCGDKSVIAKCLIEAEEALLNAVNRHSTISQQHRSRRLKMSKLKIGNVYIEISHNQAGGLSLCVGNDDGGYRISGAKVGGCETLKCFEVNAEELIAQIREHAKKAAAEPEYIDEIDIQAGIDPAVADAYMQGYDDAEARRAEQQDAK